MFVVEFCVLVVNIGVLPCKYQGNVFGCMLYAVGIRFKLQSAFYSQLSSLLFLQMFIIFYRGFALIYLLCDLQLRFIIFIVLRVD